MKLTQFSLCLVSAFGVGGYVSEVHANLIPLTIEQQQQLDELLNDVVSSSKVLLPKPINNQITWKDIRSEGQYLTYDYQMNITLKQTPDDFANLMNQNKATFTKSICLEPTTIPLFLAGGSIKFNYWHAKFNKPAAVMVHRSDCTEYHPEMATNIIVPPSQSIQKMLNVSEENGELIIRYPSPRTDYDLSSDPNIEKAFKTSLCKDANVMGQVKPNQNMVMRLIGPDNTVRYEVRMNQSECR